MSEQRVTGTVKWFNDAKGYGFLAVEGGKDVFVHHSAIVAEGFRSLAEGDKVEFSIEKGPQRPVRCQRAQDLIKRKALVSSDKKRGSAHALIPVFLAKNTDPYGFASIKRNFRFAHLTSTPTYDIMRLQKVVSSELAV
jgi:CspA family cold shock protein